MKFDPNTALVKAVELSTSHVTKLDMQLLRGLASEHAQHGQAPTVMAHQSGIAIAIGARTVEAIKTACCSPQLGVILDGCNQDGEVLYLAFDSTGPCVDGLEVFDW